MEFSESEISISISRRCRWSEVPGSMDCCETEMDRCESEATEQFITKVSEYSEPSLIAALKSSYPNLDMVVRLAGVVSWEYLLWAVKCR